MGKAVLIAGCTSDAGKSVLVAGLCRALSRRGIKVAPFKAQNMSNNSAVTPDDGEIGRAQALQAAACGLAPSVKFNPILLKPGSDRTSQLVVLGLATGNVSAKNYIEHRAYLRTVAAESLAQLREDYDVVVCEGAGSPAEINLRETDVANFGLAEAADLPVYVVGDIDRGGVLAHFFGTHQIVSAEDRARIKGFIVNKFRGDASILQPGLDALEHMTGVPTIGVLPFVDGLWIDAEDSLQSSVGTSIGPKHPPLGEDRLQVAAIRLPRISNATDVEALACEPGVSVRWVDDPGSVLEADLAVLPGSKATLSDFGWLRERGIADALKQRAQQHRPVLGICGGFQMLCSQITDAVEAGCTEPQDGLGIFDVDIEFREPKTLVTHPNGAYEVHFGQVVRSGERPWIGKEGAQNGRSFGTHRHGQLEDDAFRRAFLAQIARANAKDRFVVSTETSFAQERERQLDLLADVIEQRLDVGKLLRELTNELTS